MFPGPITLCICFFLVFSVLSLQYAYILCVSSAGIESSLDSQTEMDSAAQQSEDAALPSTSQDPGTSLCSFKTQKSAQSSVLILIIHIFHLKE